MGIFFIIISYRKKKKKRKEVIYRVFGTHCGNHLIGNNK